MSAADFDIICDALRTMRCTDSWAGSLCEQHRREAVTALERLRERAATAERELARAVERGQNLVDGIGMEREMRNDAEARAGLADTLRTALRRIVNEGNAARGSWAREIAAAALAAAEPGNEEARDG